MLVLQNWTWYWNVVRSATWYERNVRKTKAQYLWDAGRKEAALDTYEEIVQIGDSLIHYFRAQQEETVQSNYRIKKELLKQAETQNKVRWLTLLRLRYSLL